MAVVAENDIILAALTQRLDAVADRVQVCYETIAESIDIPGVNGSKQSNSWVNIKLKNGQTLKTKLLVSRMLLWTNKEKILGCHVGSILSLTGFRFS